MVTELTFWIPVLAVVLVLGGIVVARTRALVWLPAMILVVAAVLSMAPHHWKGG
jgi:hypothetical protein